jgi:hypothetical protein
MKFHKRPQGGALLCWQAELERELEARGLPKSGVKQELVDRLHAALAAGQQAQLGASAAPAAGAEGTAAVEPAGPEKELAKLTKASLDWCKRAAHGCCIRAGHVGVAEECSWLVCQMAGWLPQPF